MMDVIQQLERAGFRRTAWGKSVFYEDDAGSLVARNCGKCGEIKMVSEFSRKKSVKYGYRSYCKTCQSHDRKRYYKENAKRESENFKKWFSIPENAAHDRRRNSEWAKQNADRKRISTSKYRARRRKLADTFTNQQRTAVMNRFNGKCFITGSDTVHLDHYTPITAPNPEHNPGTAHGNMIPLDAALNISKGNRNAVDWFMREYDAGRFDDENMRNFADGIRYLAEVSEESPLFYGYEHYRAFGPLDETMSKYEKFADL